jgi:oxygen-independent coproporphyrinogen-3 oxidase
VANLGKYLAGIEKGQPYFESETLSEIDKYNEFLMTWMRTRWGVNLKKVSEIFGSHKEKNLVQALQPFIKSGSVYLKNENVILSDEGVFISDLILADLMLIE